MRTREELVALALEQLKEERDLGYGEYEVHYTIPDGKGGTITSQVGGFMADSPGDAVRFASRIIDFPEIDADDIEELEDRSEKAKMLGYGITKVRRVDSEKRFTGEDMLIMAEYIFSNYYREVNMEGSRIKEESNKEEILNKIIYLFKLPSNNRITDKARKWLRRVNNY